jgi:hypothetical protein
LPNIQKEESKYSDISKFKMKDVDTYDKGEKDLTAVDDSMPLSLRERK